MIHKLYGMGIIVFLILFAMTFFYRKKERKSILKSEYKLTFMYGLALFITDKFLKRYVNNNLKIDRAIKKINVKEKVLWEKSLYVAEKVAISLTVIFISLSIGFMATGKDKKTSYTVKSIKRDSKISKEYNLGVLEDGKKKDIKVIAAKKELSGKEIEKLFDKTIKDVKKSIRGKNKSLDRVEYDLLLKDKTKDGVGLFWTSDKPKILEHSGKLNKGGGNGTVVKLHLEMKLKNVVRDYSFGVLVFEPKGEPSLEDEIQKYVDNNDIYSSKVTLPKSLNKKSLKFYGKEDGSLNYIFFVGLILGVILFLARDRDLYKKVNDRNIQMIMDYPDLISEYILYLGAGLSFKSATQRIVKDYKLNSDKKRFIYEEIGMMQHKMKSGVSESAAINELADRCKLHSYTKFCSIIQQNLKRGTGEITKALKNELVSAMEEKRNSALKAGNEISTKLLAPMVSMLLITLVIVMVPAFLTMKASN